MSNRGRHYYNPITQMSEVVEGAPSMERVEMFQDPADPSLKRWCYRLVNPDGSVGSEDVCDFDKENLIAAARMQYPALEIFELQDPGEDSTWERMGPSPRLWQSGLEVSPAEQEILHAANPTPALEQVYPEPDEQIALRVVVAGHPGTYVLIDDVLELLNAWALQFEEAKNPSGAMALREAIEALSDVRQP